MLNAAGLWLLDHFNHWVTVESLTYLKEMIIIKKMIFKQSVFQNQINKSGKCMVCHCGVRREYTRPGPFGIEEVWTCVGTNLHVCGCWRGTHT